MEENNSYVFFLYLRVTEREWGEISISPPSLKGPTVSTIYAPFLFVKYPKSS
jgi:hypothetical protein